MAKSQGRESEGKGSAEEKDGKQYRVVPDQGRVQIDDEQCRGRAGDMAGASAQRRRKSTDQLQNAWKLSIDRKDAEGLPDLTPSPSQSLPSFGASLLCRE